MMVDVRDQLSHDMVDGEMVVDGEMRSSSSSSSNQSTIISSCDNRWERNGRWLMVDGMVDFSSHNLPSHT